MIDWTDRSEDVLARFEAWREWVKTQIGVDITDDLADITEAEHILMQDLATMADRVSELARRGEQSAADVRRYIQANAIDPETVERLFPDPKS